MECERARSKGAAYDTRVDGDDEIRDIVLQSLFAGEHFFYGQQDEAALNRNNRMHWRGSDANSNKRRRTPHVVFRGLVAAFRALTVDAEKEWYRSPDLLAEWKATGLP